MFAQGRTSRDVTNPHRARVEATVHSLIVIGCLYSVDMQKLDDEFYRPVRGNIGLGRAKANLLGHGRLVATVINFDWIGTYFFTPQVRESLVNIQRLFLPNVRASTQTLIKSFLQPYVNKTSLYGTLENSAFHLWFSMFL